ncbi:MAG TPA: branched-chain amino acid transaminase [Thermoanaerobaculia bacterium]|nr:branched-chain amino acid transaminase [Thermoanaerobaculia bacterium]
MDSESGLAYRTGEEAVMTLPRYAFFRGHLVPYSEARVGVLTHALNYGTAVFAGLRGYWNSEQGELFLFRPADHFRRFLESARLLGMELQESEESLSTAAVRLLRADLYREDCYLRPLAFYADESIGVRLHDLTPAVSMVAFPYGRYLENDETLHATVSSWRRVDDNMIPARGKIAGAYVNSALAKTDAQRAGFDDAILLNQDGHVAEASAANFFLVRNGLVATPPTTDNVLEGITRRTAMELLQKELGLSVRERSIDRTEIYLADEIFLCGTGTQIAAITRVDHRPIGSGKMGPAVAALRKLFFEIVRGRRPEYQHWCLPVYAGASGLTHPEQMPEETAAPEPAALRLAR